LAGFDPGSHISKGETMLNRVPADCP